MRPYQENIYSAVIGKKDWSGSNVVINTANNITNVYFYGNLIAVVNHTEKTARYNNCGYNNACTTSRINAVKMACKEMGYK